MVLNQVDLIIKRRFLAVCSISHCRSVRLEVVISNEAAFEAGYN
jgi:hypothetical protein